MTSRRVAVPYSGQGFPRTVDDTPREITYDAAGNIATYEIENGTKTYRYTYDYRNQLIKVESKTTGSYSTVTQYLYDGVNRRVVPGT